MKGENRSNGESVILWKTPNEKVILLLGSLEYRTSALCASEDKQMSNCTGFFSYCKELILGKPFE